MILWDRALSDQPCGSCGHPLRRGDPRCCFTASAAYGGRRFVRCAACAGEPAPADLPPLEDHHVVIVPTPKASTMTRFPLFAARAGKSWRDGKAAALPREREPGEDDA